MICGCLILNCSCKKDWLEIKPDNKLVVLSSLSDYQSFLDNSALNGTNGLGETGTDNYFVYNFNSLSLGDINTYEWAPEGYGIPSQTDWTQLYRNILACNTTLVGLTKIKVTEANRDLFNQVYGSALLFRGMAYYELAQTFIKPYDSSTAQSDPGLPVRLDPDITLSIGRGTVQQTYDQFFSDLTKSVTFLQTTPPAFKIRPFRASAFALLARAYLSVKNYAKALAYADSAMQTNSTLLNYNTVVPVGTITMPHYDKNPEVFFHCIKSTYITRPLWSAVDSTLYNSYSNDDLRKKLFFSNAQLNPAFKSFVGTYYGYSTNTQFSGPAVDELYLIKAECEARTGNVQGAMDDLNALLVTRWKTNTYIPFTAVTSDDALNIILTERRKELIMRGVRWTDLRRLNSDPKYAVTITHVYNGQAYLLHPNDPKYVWPIPDDEILYSGIAQNLR